MSGVDRVDRIGKGRKEHEYDLCHSPHYPRKRHSHAQAKERLRKKGEPQNTRRTRKRDVERDEKKRNQKRKAKRTDKWGGKSQRGRSKNRARRDKRGIEGKKNWEKEAKRDAEKKKKRSSSVSIDTLQLASMQLHIAIDAVLLLAYPRCGWQGSSSHPLWRRRPCSGKHARRTPAQCIQPK